MQKPQSGPGGFWQVESSEQALPILSAMPPPSKAGSGLSQQYPVPLAVARQAYPLRQVDCVPGAGQMAPQNMSPSPKTEMMFELPPMQMPWPAPQLEP